MASKSYRRIALQEYDSRCVHCGFGIEAVLEVAHVNHDRSDNRIENLVVLCPTCHKMMDIGLIPVGNIEAMRDAVMNPDWKIRMKDAGIKAALKRKRKQAARKAVETRLLNKSKREQNIKDGSSNVSLNPLPDLEVVTTS